MLCIEVLFSSFFFFLFKQKTAYEMRISDWSSDVCSSDLRFCRSLLLIGGNRELQRIFPAIGIHIIHAQYPSTRLQGIRLADYQAIARAVAAGARSEERRVGKECVSKCRSRGSPVH